MRIAITGTMGAGKSLVNRYLVSLGYDVYDTDKMVHEYYEPQGKLYDKVIDLFGESIVTGSTIDRSKLAAIVFSDAQKLKALEGLAHPAVLEDISSVDSKGRLVFFEVPQLFESQMASYFDAIVMIDADEEIRFQRLLERGMDAQSIRNRFKHQMPGDKKAKQSDYVIDNSEDIPNLYKQIDALIESLEGEK